MEKQRRILITGASSGIGKGLAEYFAGKGDYLYLGGLEEEKQMRTFIRALKNKGAVDVVYDNSNISDGLLARSMVQMAAIKMGGIDVLINNAGIQHVSPIEEFSIEMWQSVMQVNLFASFHTIAAAIPHMLARKFGRIINIASVHGLVASKNKSAYVASKHGLVGLTKVVALEQAEGPITCNAICPGWVKTQLVEEQIKHRAEQKNISIHEEEHHLLSEKQPNERFVSISEIAEMAGFLCGDGAANITGSSFVMDGGWTAQ